MVDLGLPSGILWAKCNLGAENEQDYGNFYAWGETDGYTGITTGKQFSWADYKFGTSDSLVKYNTTDGKTTLDNIDDAAYVSLLDEVRIQTSTIAAQREYYMLTGRKFIPGSASVKINLTSGTKIELVDNGSGAFYTNPNITASEINYQLGKISFTLTNDPGMSSEIIYIGKIDNEKTSTLRMPTKTELEELLSGTTQSNDTVSGVSGTRFTSKTNSNSIFVPFAGGCGGGRRSGGGSYSLLWSSSVYGDDSYYAWNLIYLSNGNRYVNCSRRYGGYSVRAVKS